MRRELRASSALVHTSQRSCYPLPFHHLIRTEVKGGEVNDSVAIDAKRILLRYGAPISVLDKVTEADRIEFARAIARTTVNFSCLIFEGCYRKGLL